MSCENRLVKTLVNLAKNRDNNKRPTNGRIYQCENIGQMGSFLGRFETSGNSANLPTFILGVVYKVVGSAGNVMLECCNDVGEVWVVFLSEFGKVDNRSKLVFRRYDNPLLASP